MVDYIRSDQPTISASTDVASESLLLTVTNPAPTGGRPTVTSNQVWRRATGETGSFTLVGVVPNNGSLLDASLRASTSYDYFAVTDTFSESTYITVTSPFVTGIWMSAAADPSTFAHYPYTDGGSESLDEVEAVLSLIGRTYPVVEAGVQETQTVTATVTIPFSDTNWRTQVEWWRTRKRERRTLLYRDGRGRQFACRIIGAVSLAPLRSGTQISCTLQRVDFTASTTSLDPAYFANGAYNNGGNGAYGNGAAGNGV